MLQKKGVNLVFFEDGPLQRDKSEKVTNDQNKIYDGIFEVLDNLSDGNVKQLLENYAIGNLARLISGIRAVARKYGEFNVSFHNECDKEIVAYATRVNAMAILSDDTDYLIFKGNWSYWSSKHINFDAMTTKSYNKIQLQQYLQLTEDEMALLATLAGNDLISKDLLDRFHRYLGNPWNKFKNISRYIIRHFRILDSYEPEYIARKVFGNVKDLPKYTDLVRKSLNSYNISILKENNDNNFMQKIKCLPNDCYAYLMDLSESYSISFFDVRTPEFEKYPSLVLVLIQRQVGIILQHKNDKSLIRHIYGYQNKQVIYEKVIPEYPTFLVPDLDDLYNYDKNDELKMVKLRMIAWILSDRLDFHKIATIEKKYFCACLTLYYMVENAFITVREADTFLHMIETVYANFSTIIKLPYLERVDPRAIQLIYLYDKLYEYIKDAISNCGLFELIELNHMDGLYFHHVYNKLKGDLITTNEKMQIHLNELRLYEEL